MPKKKTPYRRPYHICNKKYTNQYEENFEDFFIARENYREDMDITKISIP